MSTLSSGFDKTKALAQRTLSRMDNFIGEASSSMTTYIALFVIIIVALIFKVALWRRANLDKYYLILLIN
jgi:hypothetical protein